MTSAEVPPPQFARYMGLPYTWWRHLRHRHIHVFMNEVGCVMCAICWTPLRPGSAL